MIKTSESVLRGHPDKICDQVADYILTELIKQDKDTRAGIECLIKDELLLIAGEITTNAALDYKELARQCLEDIGLDSKEFEILEKISIQSSDIALGVDKGGAGDQGIMYGYAESDTEELMPLPIVLSRKLAIKLDELNTKEPDVFGKDGKCQISVRYDNDKPVEITAVVVSVQTRPEIKIETYEPMIHTLIKQTIPNELMTSNTKVLINPTGEFVKGGSYADSGLTGRKLQCDSYGGLTLHGGGAWSGKDLSKVDRSASYYARYIAKNIVAARLAKKCEIGVAYAIGIKEPVSVSINTFGTSSITEEKLLKIIHQVFNFEPKSITNEIGANNYYELSSYGHVGVITNKLPWERLDKVDSLRHLAYDNPRIL
ncbi:S-adenosylmethionine synthase [Acholeplasma oculi]|uniref:Methionine adenosyltransferase n=1 Tax=Acholeplasma oculi TaxID=35623 RepID=A0A061AAS2_9MOLU|nr:methionine adenosyltransferase [Acholeplasma oculi]CDR30943.1 S-Adenosylmethionine synthetase [Acholeplasma oculi]SKC35658.1 methionine adenosyltransferase [Acholeplasma oculi]SUT90233.1 S-adenosylmethionine synthase [Acholeplasma oculi]